MNQLHEFDANMLPGAYDPPRHDDENAKLRMQLSMEISDKERIEKENHFLRKQLEELKLIHVETLEFATYIENELSAKVAHLTSQHATVHMDSDMPFDTEKERQLVVQWRERVALEVMHNEELKLKIEMLQKELEHVKILYLNTVEHSTGIENALEEKNQQLSIISVTDHLTKIYNRLKFHVCLKNEIESTKKTGKPLFLIMFDIDHFKNINDQYGHDCGDYALKSIVEIVRGGIRDKDIFARWGGEEFMILVPDCCIEDVKSMLYRIREMINSYQFDTIGNLTCSFGLTQYLVPEESQAFLKRVDDALYKSKNEGRNRITIL